MSGQTLAGRPLSTWRGRAICSSRIDLENPHSKEEDTYDSGIVLHEYKEVPFPGCLVSGEFLGLHEREEEPSLAGRRPAISRYQRGTTLLSPSH